MFGVDLMAVAAPIYKLSWYNGIIREKNNSDYEAKRKTAKAANSVQKKGHKLKLDQIMRVLFRLSKQTTLNMINRLFDEGFTSEEVEVHYGNSEFIQDNYDRIMGDLFIALRKSKQVFRYHIEFQTLNDSSMVIRMFRYGFEKAIELAGSKDADQSIILEFPRQLVIFLEENKKIQDPLTMMLRLPNGEVIPYTVPVMKYWKYTAEELREQKMYSLLPLQAFKLRKQIEAIYKSRKTKVEKSRLITGQFALLKETIQRTVNILGKLHDNQEIRTADLERLLRVLQNINEYLYQRYGEYQTIQEEVHHMVKTLYDPRIKREGKMEGIEEGRIVGKLEGIKEGKREGIIEGKKVGKFEVAQRLLLKGLKAEEVAEITGLSVEDIIKSQA